MHGAARQFWAALLGFDGYLRGQSARLVNYAERRRAGLRAGTSITEEAANPLVNRRMNKSQQMRWSRGGADLLLRVRCAVYNGQITPDLTQSMCRSRGGLVSIGNGTVSVSSCRRARKPPEARDSLRAARRAPPPTSSALPCRSRRRYAGAEHGQAGAAA